MPVVVTAKGLTFPTNPLAHTVKASSWDTIVSYIVSNVFPDDREGVMNTVFKDYNQLDPKNPNLVISFTIPIVPVDISDTFLWFYLSHIRRLTELLYRNTATIVYQCREETKTKMESYTFYSSKYRGVDCTGAGMIQYFKQKYGGALVSYKLFEKPLSYRPYKATREDDIVYEGLPHEQWKNHFYGLPHYFNY
jgi:hypothetical protein